MEKTREEILSEINAMLADIRERMSVVESKLAEYEAAPEVVDILPDEEGAAWEYDFVVPEQTIVLEDFSDMDPLVAEPLPEPESMDVPEPVFQDIPEPVAELPAEPEPVIPVEATAAPEEPAVQEPVPYDPLMDIFGMPQDDGTVNSRHRRQKKAVMDVMASKEAWRTDIPGSPVRDIKSAISLNDRLLFIRVLFDGDPQSFQEMLTSLNGMASFNDAQTYIRKHHPEWNYDSDTVYRFMMAVRRKLD